MRMPEWRMTRRQFAQGTTAMALGALVPGATGAAADSEVRVQGSIDADPSTSGTTFNRMIFGQFLEHFHRQVYGGVFDPGSHLTDRNGFRSDVLEALRELRVPIVRWPGGCFASAYHWRDGVGNNRQPSFDKAWGVEEPNLFGTDEFVKWCRLLGAEPYVCTNAGTGTSEEMSDWVEYCNLKGQGRYARLRQQNGCPEPHNVRYWSIGNENYLGGEIGAKTVQEWGPLVRESAKMMRSVDSEVRLVAAATVTGNWTAPMLQDAGKYLNYISIHGYWDRLWQHGTTPSDYVHCMAFTEMPEQQIRQAVTLLEGTGYVDRIKIAFDEWNLRGWHHPGFPGGGADRVDEIRERDDNDRNETYTMADAVFSASFLNACLRQAKYVEMACMAPVVNARGPLFVHPDGIVKRTTFHVLRMYSDLLQPQVLESRVTSDPLTIDGKNVSAVDAVATCSQDRRQFALAMVNRHPERAARWRVGLGVPRQQRARVTILEGDSTDAYNGIEHPDRVAPAVQELVIDGGAVDLPPHSVAVLQWKL